MEETVYLLSEENAQKQVDLLFEWYGRKWETLDKDQQTALSSHCIALVNAIRKGHLEIKKDQDELKIHQTLLMGYSKLSDMAELNYKEVNAKAKRMIPDPSDDCNHYSRIYSLIQYLTGLSKAQFDSLRSEDLRVAEALGSLFLLL